MVFIYYSAFYILFAYSYFNRTNELVSPTNGIRHNETKQLLGIHRSQQP